MTRMQQFQSVIDAWKRKDIEAVLGAMTDDVVWHYAAAIAPPARGKAEARAFIEAFGANIGEVRWRIFHHSETGDRLFVEGVDEYTSLDGIDIAAPYAGVIEFRDHFITERGAKLCIVMEHAAGGDLAALIDERRRSGRGDRGLVGGVGSKNAMTHLNLGTSIMKVNGCANRNRT